MKHLIIGTAGHIDHGKTELIKTLTGIDTDRLKEEKDRGITIDLGFAEYLVDDDTKVGVVDVPGHESFIRNMLAGATGIDLVLMIVAADEGVMPQTVEHLDILNLLGTKTGIVVLTKVDLVDEEWITLVEEDVRKAVSRSFLRSAPIVKVSSVTGEGIDLLRAAILRIAMKIPLRREDPLFRLPIDRIFTIRGVGTVVTGTAWSGTVKQDDKVTILPSGLQARVKGIEVHSEKVRQSVAGARTALALTGSDVSTQRIKRGDNVVGSRLWEKTMIVDGMLLLLSHEKKVLKNRSRIRFHLGTTEAMARVVLFQTKFLNPGERAYAQIRLEESIVARAGDRFVIRSYSPVRTIGGGEVLNPLAKRKVRSIESYTNLLRELEAGEASMGIRSLIKYFSYTGVPSNLLHLLTKYSSQDIRSAVRQLSDQKVVHKVADSLIDVDQVQSLRTVALQYLEKQHLENPLRLGISGEELRRVIVARGTTAQIADHILENLEQAGEIEVKKGTVRLVSHSVYLGTDEEELIHEIHELIRESDMSPSTLTEFEKRFNSKKDKILPLMKIMVDRNELVQVSSDLFFCRESLDAAKEKLADLILAKGPVSVSEIKTVIPASRKFMIPLLEYLDREGFTKRAGDKRVLKQGSTKALGGHGV